MLRPITVLAAFVALAAAGWAGQGGDPVDESAVARRVAGAVDAAAAASLVSLYEGELEVGARRWLAGDLVPALECFWRAEELERLYGIDYEGVASLEITRRLERLAERRDARRLADIAVRAPAGRAYAALALELARDATRRP